MISEGKLSSSIRYDTKLVKNQLIEIDEFTFKSDNNTSRIFCNDKVGNQYQIINEKESITETKSTLQELTERLNKQVKENCTQQAI